MQLHLSDNTPPPNNVISFLKCFFPLFLFQEIEIIHFPEPSFPLYRFLSSSLIALRQTSLNFLELKALPPPLEVSDVPCILSLLPG